MLCEEKGTVNMANTKAHCKKKKAFGMERPRWKGVRSWAFMKALYRLCVPSSDASVMNPIMVVMNH